MSKFKLGQKILCIQGDAENPIHHLLKKNEIYTVDSIINGWVLIGIKEIPNEVFNCTRFISLTEARKRKIQSLYEDSKT